MSLDVFQQVFSLCVLSTLVNGTKANQSELQQILQRQLTNILPTIGTGWQLTWGPVVLNKPENAVTRPDTAWYIAFHPSLQFEDGSEHPTYVIAVAGTPDDKLYDLPAPEFGVDTVTDFRAWVEGGIKHRPKVVPRPDVVKKGTAYIATGPVQEVHLLLTTPAPGAAKSPGTTLLDFITNLDKSASPRFITTGHSVGGDLSPSLALALVSAGYIPADRTLTYPTAGATPGNVEFADLFAQTLPARGSGEGYKGWNLNLVNTFDVVPQAWCYRRSISPKQNLRNVPSIYGKPELPEVLLTTWSAISWSRSSRVGYKPLPGQYFTSRPPATTPANLEEFRSILDWQHWEAYQAEIKIGNPAPPKGPRDLGAGLTGKTEDETRSSHPLIAALEWSRKHPEAAQKIAEEIRATAEAEGFLSDAE